jgi:hypothetical protein
MSQAGLIKIDKKAFRKKQICYVNFHYFFNKASPHYVQFWIDTKMNENFSFLLDTEDVLQGKVLLF